MIHAGQTLARPTLTIASRNCGDRRQVGDEAEAQQDGSEQHDHRHVDEIEAGEDKIAGDDQ